jgi:magnesium transporter
MNLTQSVKSEQETDLEGRAARLDDQMIDRGLPEALELIRDEPNEIVAVALTGLSPAVAVKVLGALSEDRRNAIQSTAPPEWREQWARNASYPEGAIGRLMTPPLAVLPPDLTVAEAVERLRDVVRRALVTYVFVADGSGVLIGLLTFRDLLFAERSRRLAELMLVEPFSLKPETPVMDAMRAMLRRHYPVYPVCDSEGRLIGVVRGQTLFEHEAFELSAQAGRMVGVDKDERLNTPWLRSFFMRHPWLQLNLLTAFIAAGVVGFFEETIAQIVALAVFLPVLTDQSANAGCQTLAVTLRGMTLGELEAGKGRALMLCETGLGILNGALTGVTAAIGMFCYATWSETPHAGELAGVVLFAMVGSCAASGACGSLVPLGLKRLGVDPATSSSIFLTTATNVVSMGLFLGAATWVL